MELSLEITRREYAIEIPENAFNHLMMTDTYSWDGPCLDEDAFNHIAGVHSIEHNGHFGAFVYLKVDADADTPELHVNVIEVITDRISDIKHARICNIVDMADELIDALATDDWAYIRDSILHGAFSRFHTFDAIEFRRVMFLEHGFQMTDECLQCGWMTKLIEKFPKELSV